MILSFTHIPLTATNSVALSHHTCTLLEAKESSCMLYRGGLMHTICHAPPLPAISTIPPYRHFIWIRGSGTTSSTINVFLDHFKVAYFFNSVWMSMKVLYVPPASLCSLRLRPVQCGHWSADRPTTSEMRSLSFPSAHTSVILWEYQSTSRAQLKAQPVTEHPPQKTISIKQPKTQTLFSLFRLWICRSTFFNRL